MALGAAACTATPAELEAFSRALTKNLASRYGLALLEFDGRRPIKVLGSSELPKGRGVKVATFAYRRDSTEIPVYYSCVKSMAPGRCLMSRSRDFPTL